MYPSDDTIAAVSTAAGSAARAIVRLSGEKALPVAEKLFSCESGRLTDLGGFRTAKGRVRLGGMAGGAVEIPGQVYVFRTPRSYTRQDVVEFHVPGPASVATRVCDALVALGARPAQPGEFTARAFFSGRLDLTAAEAVADVIDAADERQLRSAMATLGGRVRRICGRAALELTDVLAAVEAAIDLADEDIQPDRPAELADRLGDLAERLVALAEEAGSQADPADRPRVAIAGRPNVGKSSLLNALCGTDRAITSALAGTTRDVLGAPLAIEGVGIVVLQDVAGFAKGGDSLEIAADSAARSAVAAADVVLFVVVAAAEGVDEDLDLLEAVLASGQREILLLANKVDLTAAPSDGSGLKRLAEAAGGEAVRTSAVTGEGLEAVRELLAKRLGLSVHRPGDALGLHGRHKRSLASAARAAGRARDLLAAADDVVDVAELAAVEIRAVLEDMGRVSPDHAGAVTEDVLTRIFSRFCVGK